MTAIGNAGPPRDRDGADRDVGPTLRLGWVGPTGETKDLAPSPLWVYNVIVQIMGDLKI